MEFLAILMTGLLAGLSPVGLIVEEVGGKQLTQRLQEAETFEVRVDNLPAHQLLSGDIDKVSIASRGIEILPGVRLDTLEIETDPISFDLQQLRQGNVSPAALRSPVRAGIRAIITEADINDTLRSPQVTDRLQPLINRLLTPPRSPNPPQFKLVSATIDFVGDNRFQFNGKIAQVNPENGETEISELGIGFTMRLISGSQFRLTQASGTINGQQLPPEMLNGFAEGVSQRFNLKRFQQQGLTARFLELNVDEDQLETAMFMQFAAQRPQ
ncbi:MAG: DUF2993 domain-containing protein [Limnothrix sp. RL_2_0]|nr:DUF2993 domain-containing protein [Limnothrix sp. RL_2_0]